MTKIIIFILLIAPAFTTAAPTAKNKADIYQTIAGELLKDCTGAGKAVAVAGFSYSDGRDSHDGGVVAERITTELVKLNRFKVVERKEIEKVFSELKFQRSGAINPDSVKEIGKMLGADLMTVGTLIELPNKQLELNVRIVVVESGEILAASTAKIEKDWMNQYRILIEEQNKTIEKHVKDANAFYEKGVIYLDLREYDNAIGSFGIAISINPTQANAYLGRGNAFRSKIEWDKAIDDYSKAIVIDPKNAVAYANRGNLYGMKREYDKAIADYSEVIAITPDSAEAYYNRGYAYGGKGISEDGREMIEDYSRAIAIDPKFVRAYCARGWIYEVKGEYDKAIKDYSESIKIAPKFYRGYEMRGMLYRKVGESVKAVTDEEKSKSLLKDSTFD